MKLSIIIPVYNTEKYLKKCIDSILNQSFSDYELLLINDGSTDDSGKICDEYSKIDNRIKVLHKKNGGVSSARNTGIENASGEWVTFIDSDDWINHGYIENLVNDTYLNVDLIIHGTVDKMNKNHINGIFNSSEYNYVFNNLKLSYNGYPFSKLFKNHIIKTNNIKFIEHVNLCEDTLFLIEYLSYSTKIKHRSKCLYNYNETNDSLSRRSLYSYKSNYLGFKTINSLLKNNLNIDKLKEYPFLTNTYIGFLYRAINSLHNNSNNTKSQRIKKYNQLHELILIDSSQIKIKHLPKRILYNLFFAKKFNIFDSLLKIIYKLNK